MCVLAKCIMLEAVRIQDNDTSIVDDILSDIFKSDLDAGYVFSRPNEKYLQLNDLAMVYDTTEQDTDMEEFTKEAELLEDTFDADDDTEKIMFIDKDNPIDSIPTDTTSSTDTSSTDTPSTDTPSTDTPSTDTPSTDTLSTNTSSTDGLSTNTSSADGLSTDTPSTNSDDLLLKQGETTLNTTDTSPSNQSDSISSSSSSDMNTSSMPSSDINLNPQINNQINLDNTNNITSLPTQTQPTSSMGQPAGNTLASLSQPNSNSLASLSQPNTNSLASTSQLTDSSSSVTPSSIDSSLSQSTDNSLATLSQPTDSSLASSTPESTNSLASDTSFNNSSISSSNVVPSLPSTSSEYGTNSQSANVSQSNIPSFGRRKKEEPLKKELEVEQNKKQVVIQNLKKMNLKILINLMKII